MADGFDWYAAGREKTWWEKLLDAGEARQKRSRERGLGKTLIDFTAAPIKGATQVGVGLAEMGLGLTDTVTDLIPGASEFKDRHQNLDPGFYQDVAQETGRSLAAPSRPGDSVLENLMYGGPEYLAQGAGRVAGELGSSVGLAAKAGLKVAAGYNVARETGSAVNELREGGSSPLEALGLGVPAGLASGGLETLSLKKLTSIIPGSEIARIVEKGGTESVTEMLQKAPHLIAQAAAGQITWKEARGRFFSDETLEEGVWGGVGGVSAANMRPGATLQITNAEGVPTIVQLENSRTQRVLTALYRSKAMFESSGRFYAIGEEMGPEFREKAFKMANDQKNRIAAAYKQAEYIDVDTDVAFAKIEPEKRAAEAWKLIEYMDADSSTVIKLHPELINYAAENRELIDDNSILLIDQLKAMDMSADLQRRVEADKAAGKDTKLLEDTLAANVGEYYRRSWKAKTDPQWREKVRNNQEERGLFDTAVKRIHSDLVLKEEKKLKAQHEKAVAEFPGLESPPPLEVDPEKSQKLRNRAIHYANQLLDEDTDAFLTNGSSVEAISMASRALYKKRQDFPPEVEDLLGRPDDPRVRVIDSHLRQVHFLAKSEAMRDFLEMGRGHIFFKTPEDMPPEMAARLNDLSTKLVPIDIGQERDVNGVPRPVQWWTTPEIKESLLGVTQQRGEGSIAWYRQMFRDIWADVPVARGLAKAVTTDIPMLTPVAGGVKLSQTAFSTLTQQRNVWWYSLGSMMLGHSPTVPITAATNIVLDRPGVRKMTKGASEKKVAQRMGFDNVKDYRRFVIEATQRGVLSQSSSKQAADDAVRQVESFVAERYRGGESPSWISGAARKIGREFIEIYGDGDDWPKQILYKKEAQSLAKNRGLDPDTEWMDPAILDEAAANISRYLPSRNMVIPFARVLSDSALAFPYPQFPTELARTSANVVMDSSAIVKKRMMGEIPASGDTDLALRRLAGTTIGAVGTGVGLAWFLENVLDFPDEEEYEDLKSLTAAPWDKRGAWIGTRIPKTEMYWIVNMSDFNALDGMYGAIQRGFSQDAMRGGLEEILGAFSGGLEPALDTALNVQSGRTKYGGEIVPGGETAIEIDPAAATGAYLAEVGRVLPFTPQQRLFKAIVGDVRGNSTVYNQWVELVNQVLPVKIQIKDPVEGYEEKMFEFAEKLGDVRRYMMMDVGDPNETPEILIPSDIDFRMRDENYLAASKKWREDIWPELEKITQSAARLVKDKSLLHAKIDNMNSFPDLIKAPLHAVVEGNVVPTPMIETYEMYEWRLKMRQLRIFESGREKDVQGRNLLEIVMPQ